MGPDTCWSVVDVLIVSQNLNVNVSVVNDLAERGMHLITKFASKEERQAFLQVVEQHRKQFNNFSKKEVKFYVFCYLTVQFVENKTSWIRSGPSSAELRFILADFGIWLVDLFIMAESTPEKATSVSKK